MTEQAEQNTAAADAHTAEASAAAAAETNNPGTTADSEMLPRVPSELDSVSEPSEEPPAQSAQPTPHTARPPPGERPCAQLDPATAALYEPQHEEETFAQRNIELCTMASTPTACSNCTIQYST